MTLSVHIDNKSKEILILGEGLTQNLDDTTLTEEATYPINFKQTGKRFVLSLQYKGSKSSLFANAAKMHQFKAKDSEIKNYPQFLGNPSNNFTINNMKKNRFSWERSCRFFLVDFNPIDTDNILDIHEFLVKVE